MRKNQTIDYDQLQREVQRAVELSGLTQSKIASELQKSEGAISRAVREPGPIFAKLQCAIIEHLTGYVLEERVEYVVRKKTE